MPSGNYRARFHDPRPGMGGRWVNAPHTFQRKGAADAWLAKQRADIERGVWQHPDDIAAADAASAAEAEAEALTVEQWSVSWLREQEDAVAPSTYMLRERCVRNHVRPHLGDVRLVDLTPRMVAEWRATPGVTATAYQTIRAMLTAAVESEETRLESNPCKVKGGAARTGARGERYLFTPEQVQAVAVAIRPELRALVVLAADAGLRIGEALALHRRDIHLGDAAAWVEVSHSVWPAPGGPTLGPTKTRRARTVQILPATADALAEHMAVYTAAGEDAIVFPAFSNASRYMHSRQASKALEEALDAAGVVIGPGHYAGWHAFRHYAATRFGQAGASTAAIMRRFGWTRPMQAAHYQRADDDYERDMLDRMAARLDPGAPTWAGRAGVVDLEQERARRQA